VYGAFQGYARAFYAELIPLGEEARWYGLFSITDKVRNILLMFLLPPTDVDLVFTKSQSSSFIGPLVVGVISDLTGNIRYGFFFIILMVWSAIPILMWVDVEQGRKDAQAYVYHSISNNVVDNNIDSAHTI
jgi:UMF1 family MFS transporter